MASASSTSARNLFQDSKTRLSDRVQVCITLSLDFLIKQSSFCFQANINSIGSLARQIQRGSKSQEILGQTVKNFATVETTVSSTENNVAKLQVDWVTCTIIKWNKHCTYIVLCSVRMKIEKNVHRC